MKALSSALHRLGIHIMLTPLRSTEMKMRERRSQDRTQTKMPVRFRIVGEGKEMRISESVTGTLQNLSMAGLAMNTSRIEVDGLHISYDVHPASKNRVYLQWNLPGGRSMKAVGETVWYERTTTEKGLFAVGLRFVDISREDKKALAHFLKAS
jgi:hypothetical protein